MKHIQEYVMQIREELEGAKDYAEKSLYWKYEGNDNRYRQYHSMAEQELSHSSIIHQLAVEDIDKMKQRGYNPTAEMEEQWQKSHAEYVEKVAWIKQMLAM